MTDESKKTTLPDFEQAASAQTPAKAKRSPAPEQWPSYREITFYGAAYNLIDSFFRFGFAPGIEHSNFQTGCGLEEGIFLFYIVPQPDDKYEANMLYECAASFKREIGNVVSDQELENIITPHMTAPQDHEFILKAKTSTDLMELLDHLLKPYEIKLGFCFNPPAVFMPEESRVSFVMSPLYSLEHVRALYLHAQGIDCQDQGLGLQLSH